MECDHLLGFVIQSFRLKEFLEAEVHCSGAMMDEKSQETINKEIGFEVGHEGRRKIRLPKERNMQHN